MIANERACRKTYDPKILAFYESRLSGYEQNIESVSMRFSENHTFFGFFSISCFSLLKLNQIILNITSKDRARFALQNCIFRLCIKNFFTRPLKVQCSKPFKIFCDFLLFSRKKVPKEVRAENNFLWIR
jgi:hypothetical protein